MNYINKAEVAGTVTGEPESVTVGTRTKCSFTVMTEYAFRKDGKAVIERTYHKCVVWESSTVNRDTLRRIAPGSKVHVTGRLRQQTYGNREAYIQASKFNFIRSVNTLECPTALKP